MRTEDMRPSNASVQEGKLMLKLGHERKVAGKRGRPRSRAEVDQLVAEYEARRLDSAGVLSQAWISLGDAGSIPEAAAAAAA